MKRKITYLSLLAAFSFIFLMGDSCDVPRTSDDIQKEQQEAMLQEGTAQTGMPAIKNFRERKILKDILELRDQNGLMTYTYLENMNPTPVVGHTALGGKLTFVGESIGYGIPYATEYTNPQKYDSVRTSQGYTYVTLPQADPNGLFSPASAEGTWVLMLNPITKKAEPQYFEPRVVVSTFKFPVD